MVIDLVFIIALLAHSRDHDDHVLTQKSGPIVKRI
jgi:hypothetical protein